MDSFSIFHIYMCVPPSPRVLFCFFSSIITPSILPSYKFCCHSNCHTSSFYSKTIYKLLQLNNNNNKTISNLIDLNIKLNLVKYLHIIINFKNSFKFRLVHESAYLRYSEMNACNQGCQRGGQGTSSSSLVPYPLDKYLSHTRTYVRRVSVMWVPAYFLHIRGYPRVPRVFTKIFKKNKYLTIISVWINKSPFSD